MSMMDSRKASAMLGERRPLPGTKSPTGQSRARATTIAPWDDPPNGTNNEISPWDTDPQALMTGTRPFNQSYFNESPASRDSTPPARPISSRHNSQERLDSSSRRPSTQSNGSAESSRSRRKVSANANGSRGFQHKSLKGFFGDDPQGRKASQLTAVNDNDAAFRNNASNTSSKDPNPTITPWSFQDPEDVKKYGSAPIRQEQKMDANGDSASSGAVQKTTSTSLKNKLLHRHTASREGLEAVTPIAPSITTSRDSPTFAFPPLNTNGSGKPPPVDSISPMTYSPAQPSRSETKAKPEKKGGLLSKLARKVRHNDDDKKNESGPVQPLPVTPSPSTNRERAASQRSDYTSPVSTFSNGSKQTREESVTSQDSAVTIKSPEMPKIERVGTTSSIMSKTGGSRFGLRRDKTARNLSLSQMDAPETTAQPKTRAPPPTMPGLFNLDMDFDDMSGIVNPTMGGLAGEKANPFEYKGPGTPASEMQAPAWDAPESWAYKGENAVPATHEAPAHALPPIDEEDGLSYFMRIFRSDGTFATVSMTINATVEEVIQTLAKKSVMHDSIDNYHLLLKKNQLTRQLAPNERPIATQKMLLQAAGYEEVDHIDQVGRDDNSYLCRFTFSHEKQSGFGAGLEDDPTFNKQQKFSCVDLSGRALVTIPITFYTRAPEIVSLNLSRNLALSVPKDFVTACVNLREIKFTGNESWRVPASIAFASRLTILDLSNNRLEDLEHAELHRLTGLVSLKLANNNLSKLPEKFQHFRQLRSLNISSNNFKEVPEHIYHCRSLAELDISFNKISSLNKISALKPLERLWTTNNMLKGPFNPGFKELVNLKEIDARFNEVDNIDNVAELPNLELLLVGHNKITSFKGTFKKLKTLVLDHCPVTSFHIEEPVPTLASINIAAAKLVQFDDAIFENMPSLQKLILDKNHFSSVPSQIGRLSKLEFLSMANNKINALPASLGNLQELKYLNLRECNIKTVPPEIWYCRKLEMLNLSANVLETFPKLASAPPPPDPRDVTPTASPILSHSPSFEELGKLEDFQMRRGSQASNSILSVGGSPMGQRKNSAVSAIGQPITRKMSQISRSNTEYSMATATRKDSNLSQARLQYTFAGSLKYLLLADNRLDDEIFRELVHLQELRTLNLSYNEIDDFPQGVLRRWSQLTELYLSGNTLTSLPSDDLDENSNLKVLFLNANRFQVLPAEICNIHKLSVLDVGSNSLKYNVSNWPYDWNWNRNTNLKYLNFSANRRLEIKPATQNAQQQFAAMAGPGEEVQDLTSFNSLKHLRVLGLMDVTLLTNNVPEDSEDRRVRTSASFAGSLLYGMADTLGKSDHLSTLDLLKPNFRAHEQEIVVAMFDGQSLTSGGSKIARYLHENLVATMSDELNKIEKDGSSDLTPLDALRRTFLFLNKEMANHASTAIETRESKLKNGHRASTIANMLSADDLNAGCVAAVLYLNGTDLYIANVGDIEAIVVQTNQQHKNLTVKHMPADTKERERIRIAGGYVSRQGKLNDSLEVSRAFGYFSAMPSIIAAPHLLKYQLTDIDELIVMATKEFWDFVTVELAKDLLRAEKADLMVAAQKLRDVAIAFGATDKMMIQVLNVSDLRKRSNKYGRASIFGLSEGETSIIPSQPRKRPKRGEMPGDSELSRLEEPEAPTGEVAICFTDIKNSTALWEILPVPMRGAIQLHNQLMRRQLRIVGGYEVKTEGDAFMCSFPTVTSALLWCFVTQNSLLELPWPQEILETPHCQEKFDNEGNTIYRGLSVRMGIHWGKPVCEPDPITRRMDYFGPMVNKSARVSGIADGGQISVSTDFVREWRRTMEAYAEDDDDRRDSVSSQDQYDDPLSQQIRRELRQIGSQGFEVVEGGERKLKGLENPEFIYFMYPHGLAGRVHVGPGIEEPVKGNEKADPGKKHADSQLGSLNLDEVWKLWDLALRMEMLCSSLEDPNHEQIDTQSEMNLLAVMKERGSVLSDSYLVKLLEHQVTRVENCVNNIQIRNMLRPLVTGMTLQQQAKPMKEILAEIALAMVAYRKVKPNEGKLEEIDDDRDAESSSESSPRQSTRAS